MTKLLHISQPCLLKQTPSVSLQTRSKKGALLQKKNVQVVMTVIDLVRCHGNKTRMSSSKRMNLPPSVKQTGTFLCQMTRTEKAMYPSKRIS
jgi:hypothetical protein